MHKIIIRLKSGYEIPITCKSFTLKERLGELISYEFNEIEDNRPLFFRFADIECIVEKRDGIADRPQGWIPCSERLPSEGDEFLITWTSSVTNGPLLAFAEYEPDALLVSGGKWYLEDDMGEFEDFDVIAWMPLPEPWKGADDD